MPRILLLATVPPWPTDIGGQQRTNLLLRALEECGDVDVACVYPGSIPGEHLKETASHCSFLGHLQWEDSRFHWTQRAVKKVASWLNYPRSLELLRTRLLRDRLRYQPDIRLKQWLSNLCANQSYDVIVSRFLLPLCKTDAFQHSPVVLDVDDLASTHYETRMRQEEAPWHAKLLLSECARYCRSIQKDRFARCQHLWFASQQDLNDHSVNVSSSVLPNIPFEPAVNAEFQYCEESLESQTLLTIGSLRYEPNRHGVDWFLKEVWPSVIQSQPLAKYLIVGQANEDDSTKWQSVKGVQVVGRVEDLRPYYAQAAFTVAPILIGAGTKIKVLESLAYGRCCLVTPHSYFGYEEDFSESSGIVCSQSAAEMVNNCIKYLREPKQRVAMSQNGNDILARRYTFSYFSSQVHRALDERTLNQTPYGATTASINY